MLDTLSSPVAFATAPLGNPNASDVQTSLPNGSAQSRSKTPPSSMSFRSSSLSGDVEVDEPILARFGRRIGMTKENIPGMRHSHKNPQVDASLEEDFDESLFDVGAPASIFPRSVILIHPKATISLSLSLLFRQAQKQGYCERKMQLWRLNWQMCRDGSKWQKICLIYVKNKINS